ncbi:glycosyltransferase family 9 protein, partial [Enterobacter hormaechei]|uniref:glycosyltransferase family 9 protein n=1 Tax=Enterobacter hormaechei TaxID=158836 RepID=UPI000DA10830
GYGKPAALGVKAIAQHIMPETEEHAVAYLEFLHATTRDDKHWPETHWRRLIELMQPCGIHIKLPWGAEHERQRSERLAACFSHVEGLPKLTLAQVAAQLAGANAVVSVDTG